MAFLHQLGALIEHLVDDRRLGARDVPREVEIRGPDGKWLQWMVMRAWRRDVLELAPNS